VRKTFYESKDINIDQNKFGLRHVYIVVIKIAVAFALMNPIAIIGFLELFFKIVPRCCC